MQRLYETKKPPTTYLVEFLIKHNEYIFIPGRSGLEKSPEGGGLPNFYAYQYTVIAALVMWLPLEGKVPKSEVVWTYSRFYEIEFTNINIFTFLQLIFWKETIKRFIFLSKIAEHFTVQD